MDELQISEVNIVTLPEPDIQTVVGESTQSVVVAERETMVISAGEQGPPGAQGTPGWGGSEAYVAAEDVGGHRVLVTNGIGQLEYADVMNPAHAPQAMRISLNAAGAGADVTVQASGRITEPSWSWTPGATLYVGSNALMTETPPLSPAAFSKAIAFAETSMRVIMLNEPPVMLA